MTIRSPESAARPPDAEGAQAQYLSSDAEGAQAQYLSSDAEGTQAQYLSSDAEGAQAQYLSSDAEGARASDSTARAAPDPSAARRGYERQRSRHGPAAGHPRRRFAAAIAVLSGALAGCGTFGAGDSGGNVIANDPQTANSLADVHTRLGIGYLREGKFNLAYERLNKAVDLDPGYSTAHNGLGLLYERLGQPKEALEAYERAVDVNPSDSSAQNNYGQLLCRIGRHEEAQKRFAQVIANKLYRSPELARTNAGLCARTAGDLDLAETQLREALRINPRIPSALLAMAGITQASGRYLSARGYLQRYEEAGSATAESLWLGTQIERELGDADAAENYAMKLRSNYPDSNQARLLSETGETSMNLARPPRRATAQ